MRIPRPTRLGILRNLYNLCLSFPELIFLSKIGMGTDLGTYEIYVIPGVTAWY